MEELIQPGSVEHLQKTANQMMPYLSYSLEKFWPETLLVAGFILTILLDLFLRRTSHKKFTGYFAALVLAVVAYFSYQQWSPMQYSVVITDPGTQTEKVVSIASKTSGMSLQQ